MFKMSEYTFVAGLLSIGLALLCYVLSYAAVRVRAIRTATATGRGIGTLAVSVAEPARNAFATYGTLLAWLAAAFILASMIFRAVATGHGTVSEHLQLL